MGEKLNNAITDLQHKYNFANLKEEHAYVNEVKEAIQALEQSGGGGGGVTEQSVTDMTNYYDKTEVDDKFITKVNGNAIVKTLAPKSGLYKDNVTPINLETQCQSLQTASTDHDGRLSALETATRQATLSAEQMKQIESNILTELLKKMAK